MVDKSPPAFPNSVQPDFQYADPGMSLRDWFAGQALAGILASFPPNAHFSTDKSKQALKVAKSMRQEPTWPDFEEDRKQLNEWLAAGMPTHPIFTARIAR